MSAAECEALLGPRGSLTVTSENRQTVQKWLTARGVPASVAKSARLATLAKAYNDLTDRYLNAIIRNTQGQADTDTGNDENPPAETPAPAPAPVPPVPQVPAPTPAPNARNDAQQESPAPMMPDTPAAAPKQASDLLAQALALIAKANAANVDEATVIRLIQQHAPKPETQIIRHEIEIKDKGETRKLPNEPRHEIFPEALRVVAAECHLFLVGPAGSGKTTLASQIAKALNLPFFFNGALDSPYKLSGFIDAQGRIISTAFRRAYQDGGVYLFDEIDASLPGALLAFNAALANGHADFPDCAIERHKDFRCIAAANTYGLGADRQYVGRNQLDAASLDRFVMMEMAYDEKLERELYGDTDWTAFVQKARRAIATLKLRHVVSPRASMYGTKLIEAGMERAKVERVTIWKGMAEADVTKVKAAMGAGA